MRLLLINICLIAFSSYAQDLVVVSKVTTDSISIKWLPNSFAQLEKITQGATISRAESDKPVNYQLVNFTNAKQWTIAPTTSRLNALGSAYEDQKFKALVEPILTGVNDKEQQNFAMLTATIENTINPRFQLVLGNCLIDKEFDKTKTYVYKIEVKGLPIAYIFVDAKSNTTYSPISEFELSLDRKKTVMVEWNSNAVQKEALGFLIEHSMDSQQEGNYLSELAHIPFKTQFELADKKSNVIDEALEGHWHYYRVHGLDPFGHPSLLSEWKRIYVPLLVHAHVQVDTIMAVSSERQIRVSAALLKRNPNIETWELLRSAQKDTGYQQVATKPYTDSIAQFTLKGKASGDQFYYKIQAINADDTVSSLPYYFFTLDQEPPVAPTQLKGTIDSSGVVRLNWVASVDEDIRGYKVFRGNQQREEFIERTTDLSTDLGFKDTLALDNLTSEVYYYVQAVDLNFNVSGQSDTLLLLKPDTIAPMAAALKTVSIVDTSLLISWVNSDSDDLARITLIRNQTEFIPLQKGQTTYTDFDLTLATHYSYQILTEDKSGNQSYSQEVGQYYETGYRLPLRGFDVSVNRQKNQIELSWNAPQEAVFSYQIFRSKNAGKLTLIKTLSDPKQLQYIDNQLSIGTQYQYSIKYINQEGIHSLPVSQEVIY